MQNWRLVRFLCSGHVLHMSIQRVARVQKKIEQRKLYLAQAELRQTRTRRQTRKPDYVYDNTVDSEVKEILVIIPS